MQQGWKKSKEKENSQHMTAQAITKKDLRSYFTKEKLHRFMFGTREKQGAGKMIANAAVRIMGGSPSEFVAISVLFLIAGGLTQVMSNTASCALLAPIGLQIAEALGASPAGVLMAIGIASSCAFMTPMATPPNTLVMGPGKIKFNEYLKIGTPLVLIGYVICILVIPRVWPFFG